MSTQTIKGTTTIDLGLQNNFTKSIEDYAKYLNSLSNSENMSNKLFQDNTIQPRNLPELLKEYINLGINDLVSKNVPKVRARSISKYTFGKILERNLAKLNF